MNFSIFSLSVSVLLIAAAACSAATPQKDEAKAQIVLSFPDESNTLSGVELRYFNATFLTPTQADVGYMPDQGPILYDHIELSPRIGIVPVTDMVNEKYPLSLTLPVQETPDIKFDMDDVYVMAWGDAGWVKFSPVNVGRSSVTIEITEILYDPFVAVIDR